MPEELVNALFIIYEMADDNKMDLLYETAKKYNVELDSDPDTSAGDLATQLYLKNPKALEKVHAEIFSKKLRAHHYFKSDQPAPDNFTLPDNNVIIEMQNALNKEFSARKYGRGCRLECIRSDTDKINIIIRHGRPFKREGCLKDDKSDTVFYRPEMHAVIVYNQEQNEISINNTAAKWQKELYLNVIGKYLFGAEDYFLSGDKFTFETLRADGEKCLVCSDIPGIEYVKLTEVHLKWISKGNPQEVRKSDNYFTCSQQWREDFPSGAKISTVQLLFRFTGEKSPKRITISSPNIASSSSDNFGELIDTFLMARGFVMAPSSVRRQYDANIAPCMESA